MTQFTVEQRNPKCIAVRVEVPSTVGWEWWCLLRADAHDDHPASNTRLQTEHLNEALARGAPIFDFGDFACAMQAPHDPRMSYDGLKAEHKRRDYLNSLVDSMVERCLPYKDLWVLWAMGNHETGILKHHSFNLTEEVARRLREQHGGIGYEGGYEGWVQFMFTLQGSERKQVRLWYTHGRGGLAQVTRGVIKTARRAVRLPDADIVVGAHIHTEFRLGIPRIRLTDHGKEYQDEQLHIQLPTYKDSVTGQRNGWEVEHELPPPNLGATWLVFRCRNSEIKVDALRAV
jgi:hypothetical protein